MARKGNAAPTPCPSEQAYRRHLYHGEEPCDGCRQAHRDHRAATKPAQSSTGIHIGEKPLGPGECGTMRGYRWHRKIGEPTCQDCKDHVAERAQSKYRKTTGTAPGRILKPCGTRAAYQRHIQYNEDPCDACKAAHSAYTNTANKVSRIVAAMTSNNKEEKQS